jgi:guanosine-3',5'-bis(diphosphate) 3'-pyrophosphohydrolase
MNTSKLYQKAIKFSVKAHKNQVRKGDGKPYVTHPLSVMWRVLKYKKTANIYMLASASLLHDTVEDCGVSLKKIAKKFGYNVAALVKELTLDKRKYKTIGKAEYVAQQALKMSSYALVIKLCDRLDNVCDMEHMSKSFQTRYIKETEYLLDRLKERKLTNTHKDIIKKIKKELKKSLICQKKKKQQKISVELKPTS